MDVARRGEAEHLLCPVQYGCLLSRWKNRKGHLAASRRAGGTGNRRTTRKQEWRKEWRILLVPARARTSLTATLSQICRRTMWGNRWRLSASWFPPAHNFQKHETQIFPTFNPLHPPAHPFPGRATHCGCCFQWHVARSSARHQI